MSRQLDKKREEREARRRVKLVKALEYELADTLELQGITLLGFAVNWDSYGSLMVLKADIGGSRSVAFVGGDSVISCVLSSVRNAQNDVLVWKTDVYHPSVS